nr:MAG TPA: hypothetical protein [Caudoviricetes sp.]
MADKLTMFGKSYNKLGNNETNLCLCTSGDITIKTANRFIPLFKNGKINIENSDEFFIVESESDIKKNGIYIVNSKNSDGNDIKQVFLYIDGIKLLISTTAEEYLSYTKVQQLKPEQIIQALSNIGIYFQTIDSAKASGIKEGLVYILKDQKLYKVVSGEFVEAINNTVQDNSTSNSNTVEKDKIYTTLRIGNIFINGEDGVLSVNGELSIQVNGSDFIWFRNNRVFVKRDLILDSSNTLMFSGSQQGVSGFMVYTKNEESYLEIDNLLVHKTSSKYEPKMYSTYIGTSVKNQIKRADWVLKPSDISLILKYKNQFVVGDYVLVQTTGRNPVNIYIKKRKVITIDGKEKTVNKFIANLTHPASKDTILNIKYQYATTAKITLYSFTKIEIPEKVLNKDTGEMEPNIYGESVELDFEIANINAVEIEFGDRDIYYGETGGEPMPIPMIGTVVSDNPLTINLPNQKNTSDSILTTLEHSPIYKIGGNLEEVHILVQYDDSISLQKCSVVDGKLEQKTVTQIGELSSIPKPKTGSTTNWFTGQGIYSDNLVGINPQFYGGIFEGADDIDYPKYAHSLNIPTDAIDDVKYDNVIPNIAWVKKLIEKSK